MLRQLDCFQIFLLHGAGPGQNLWQLQLPSLSLTKSVELTLTDISQETWQRVPQLVYGSFTNVTQFVVPFATIVICYTKIMIRLHQRAQCMPGSRTAKQRQEEAARNSRINKMLIAMVVIFGTCWFPINLINLAADTIDLGEFLPC